MFLNTIWATIDEWDKALFVRLNSDWTNPVFDAVMPWLRHSYIWTPLYLFVFVFVLVNFRSKALWWIVFFLVTVALTDMIGTYIFKHNFLRLRPCRDPEFSSYVRLLIRDCAGGYSFTSNHAANHVGMASFFYFTFRKFFPRWAWIGLVWAAIICYAQVYVGVHFPIDIIGGALIGFFVGSFTSTVFNKRFRFVTFDNQPIANS